MKPIYDQHFVELSTPHFVITSSLDESATLQLASNLELFHAGVEVALGLAQHGETRLPVRVFAFDDRSIDRSFALRGAKAYLVPAPRGPLLVLRTPDDWAERVTLAVREGYAHEVLRRRDPTRRSLWYEEGLAQLASTVAIDGPRVRIGAPVVDHVRALRAALPASMATTLETADLSGMSDAGRQDFEARAWALVHYLTFRDLRQAGPSALASYRAAVDAGAPNPEARAFGEDPAALAASISAHVQQPRFEELLVRPSHDWRPDASQLRPLAIDAARERIGALALRLGRHELAHDYFRRALQHNPENARAFAGGARAAAAYGDWAAARQRIGRALALDAGDADVQLGAGDLLLDQLFADPAAEPRERGERLAAARRHLRRAVELAPSDAAPRASLARSYLFPGEDARQGVAWCDTARKLNPASLELELIAVELSLHEGLWALARLQAREIYARSHWAPTRAAALAALERAERR